MMSQGQDEASTADNADESGTLLTKRQRFLNSFRTKGKVIAAYVLDGFAPFAAVAALIIAVMAINANQSSQAQAGKVIAKMEMLNSNLLAYKSELAKLRADMALQAAKEDGTNKKLDGQELQIIQSVSKLQKKMKISPTLEEQMQVTASSVTVQPSNMPTAAAKVTTPVSAPAKTIAPTSSAEKSVGRIDVLRDAINKFNQK